MEKEIEERKSGEMDEEKEGKGELNKREEKKWGKDGERRTEGGFLECGRAEKQRRRVLEEFEIVRGHYLARNMN